MEGEWRILRSKGGRGGGGGGDGLEAGQHQELSGETVVWASRLRLWCWFPAVHVAAAEEEEEEVVGSRMVGVVVMVVSRQRRRLILTGWVWDLR